jgi:Flp pilus assembly protein TadG
MNMPLPPRASPSSGRVARWAAPLATPGATLRRFAARRARSAASRPAGARARAGAREGTAVIEFAFVFPVLLALIGGVGDFGLYLWSRARLADAVTYGAQYAYLVGAASGANTKIASTVTKVAAQSLSGVSVSVTGPACYCLTGNNPPTMTAQTCTTKCAASAALPGQYVTIQASYAYTSIMPVLSRFLSPTMYETVTTRVQ